MKIAVTGYSFPDFVHHVHSLDFNIRQTSNNFIICRQLVYVTDITMVSCSHYRYFGFALSEKLKKVSKPFK